MYVAVTTYGVQGLAECEIFPAEPLDNLIFAVVLANASDSDTQTVVELAVRNTDVCAVSF